MLLVSMKNTSWIICNLPDNLGLSPGRVTFLNLVTVSCLTGVLVISSHTPATGQSGQESDGPHKSSNVVC